MAFNSTDPLDIARGPNGVGFARDANGGIYLGFGPQAVADVVRRAVQMFKGEWFLDQDVGPPWLAGSVVSKSQAILGGKSFNAQLAAVQIAAEVQAAPGVGEIRRNQVAFDKETRKMTVDILVLTAFGDVVSTTVEMDV